MKTIRIFILWIIVIAFCTMPALSSAAENNGGNDALKAMITELEKKIKDADQRMVAHPKFLEELRALVEKYKSSIRQVFFKDNFKDGNFLKNPIWKVSSGNFLINDAFRLASSVFSNSPAKPQKKIEQQKPKTVEEQAVGLVLDSLFGKPKKETTSHEMTSKAPEETPEEKKPAAIFTKANIPPDFEINVTFLSNSKWGDFEIILLGTDSLVPQYRLSYKAGSSSERPLELIRESRNRKFIIEAATKYPVTDDGQLHQIKWIRYTNGAMKVLMDDDVILETYEVYFRDNFTGLQLINNGGAYEFASVEALKALKQDL